MNDNRIYNKRHSHSNHEFNVNYNDQGNIKSMNHSIYTMSMFFHGGHYETVLFNFWQISTIDDLIMSIVGVIIMATLYEGLKYYREYIFMRTCNGPNCRGMSRGNTIISDNNQIVRLTMMSWMHMYQTSLHIIQVSLSYLLMLIFMTYNIWLCLAIIFGISIGFFLFGWKKSVIVDITEHCH
ncbi:high affinity copper uptake protein 1-like [Leptopilina boulardi]|uniref:high affinity copper uptake protein 1-like n=1 Tax=Leptopilina boulardi TaxID=63433 RepID=UPI0021F61BBF|nr:high affinity copper uptake protein 1-like [Leptopilina boulardi]